MNEQVKESDVLPLKQQEIDLIYLLRNKYAYGNVELIMRDGIPVDVIRTVQRIRLGNLSTGDLNKM